MKMEINYFMEASLSLQEIQRYHYAVSWNVYYSLFITNYSTIFLRWTDGMLNLQFCLNLYHRNIKKGEFSNLL